MLQKSKTVIIVGAGFAGIKAATELEAKDKSNSLRIILVERNNYTYCSIASVRAAVDPQFSSKIVIPLDKLFKKSTNKVVHGSVSALYPTFIVFENTIEEGHQREEGWAINFDYLVIATGSDYSTPFKAQEIDASTQISLLTGLTKRIAESKSIIFIGGGPVALETAGEVRSLYPDIKMTIITSGSSLIPASSKKFQAKILSKVTDLGIEVVFNTRIKDLKSISIDTKGSIHSDNGQEYKADMYFNCAGFSIQNTAAKTLGDVIGADGFIKVNEHMQVEGFSNIFSIGDVSNADRGKFAYLTDIQAPVAAKNILALVGAESKGNPTKLFSYSRQKADGYMILITLGKKDGAAQLPKNIVVGSILPNMIKGGSLFAPKSWSSVNQAMPK